MSLAPARRPVRTRFDDLLSLPPALRIGRPKKRLVLSPTRVAWLRALADREHLSRKQLAAELGGVHATTYRTYVPLIEHGLIDGRFECGWSYRITAQGRARLAQRMARGDT